MRARKICRCQINIYVTGSGLISAAKNEVNFFESVFSQITLQKDISLEVAKKLKFKQAALSLMPSVIPKLPNGGLDRLDFFSQYAILAAFKATEQAKLKDRVIPSDRIAVIIGTANAGMGTLQTGFEKILVQNKRPHPLTIPKVMGNGAASAVSSLVGAKGPVFGVTSACASGAQAIALGYHLLKSRSIDVAIVGGADACDSFGYLQSWNSLGVVDPNNCKPFDKDRAGLSIGDGAAILVLENGKNGIGDIDPLSRICGVGMSADGGKQTTPDADGMIKSMHNAITSAELNANDIGYINAHGTGTKLNDLYEAQAIREVFGKVNKQPLVSSTKPIHGHAMGASGAIEALIAIESLRRQEVPGTFGCKDLDTECDINLAKETTTVRNMKYALSNSFAFGGINCSLVFGSL